MKNLIISSLLLLLALSSTTAQNFAPVGAKWYYTQYEFTGSGVGYTWFESVKDTVVNDRACRKLEWGGSPCAWPSQFVYDSNDSVFFYHSQRDEFCLLYDFGASVGDVWTVYHLGQDSTVLTVDSLGTALIDDIPLRVIHTSVVNQWENFWQFFGTMTERIGADYLFPVMGICDPVPGELRCYQDSEVSFHQGPYECDEVITSVEGIVPEDELKVYPSPFEDFLTVKFSNSDEDLEYVLTTSIGSMVLRGKLKGKGNTFQNLDTSTLQSGIYILSISNSISTHTFKVIKS